MAELKRCANCDDLIGRLETPYLWAGHVLCGTCHARLSKGTPPSSQPEPTELLTDDDVVPDADPDFVPGFEQPVMHSLHYAHSQPHSAFPPAAPGEVQLCRVEGVIVTSRHIIDSNGRLPIEHVLSVKPSAGFLPGTVVVDVYDLVRRSYRFKFRRGDNAKVFVAALQRAKGSITVEQDQSGWFIMWW